MNGYRFTDRLRSGRVLTAYWILWAFVGLVSLYDGWLLVANRQVIAVVEENPVCRFLIHCDGGDLNLLLHWKAVGTAFVLLVLQGIRLIAARWAILITGGVAAFQAMLLCYLTMF